MEWYISGWHIGLLMGAFIVLLCCIIKVLALIEREAHMPKKSQGKSASAEALEHITDGKIEESMVVYITTDGERIYLHSFENKIHALEFLEIMVAGLRADILESIEMRSLN